MCASTWEEDNSFLGGSCLCLCMFCRHCQSLLVSGDSDMTDQLRFVLPSYCIKCVFGQACLVKMAWHWPSQVFFFRLLLTKVKSRSIKMQNRTRPTSVIFFRIVMVSPGTHLVKKHESQFRTRESHEKANTRRHARAFM